MSGHGQQAKSLSSDKELKIGRESDLELLTVGEVKEILKVCDRTVYKYLRSGELKGTKIGRGKSGVQWRIHRKDLEDFMNGRKG